MTQVPDNEEESPGNADSLKNKAVTTPQELRNPRATRKGPDMPEDEGGHRTDPEEDYAKPDGSERQGPGRA